MGESEAVTSCLWLKVLVICAPSVLRWPFRLGDPLRMLTIEPSNHRTIEELKRGLLVAWRAFAFSRLEECVDAKACACPHDFRMFTEAQLLQGRVEISAADFYSAATAAVEVVYNRFDSELMGVERRCRP